MAATYTVAAGDTLNAIAAKYGFSNYKTAGISGFGANPDAITPGMKLTIGGAADNPTRTPAPVGDPTKITDTKTSTLPAGQFTTPSGAVVDAATGKLITPPAAVHDMINGTQSSDQSAAAKAGAPGTSAGAQSLVDTYASIAAAIAPKTAAPTAPDLTAKYTTLRANMGVDDLESSLNDLNSKKTALQATLYGQQINEQGKPVAMNVIEGRMTEEQAQAAQKIALLDSQISTANSQLTTKYNVINSIMQYTNTDYTNAKDTYNTQLSQNLQMIQLAKGITDTSNNQAELAKDDARANLQVIYNNITSTGTDVTKLDTTTQATIQKLELQAGLPAGFFSTLTSKNPKADIVSTTERVTGGVKYADVIMRAKDGSLSTQTIKLGADSTGSGNGSTADQQRTGYGIINQLSQEGVTMADGTPYIEKGTGYYTAKGFKTLVEAAIESGIKRSDFIAQNSDKISPTGATGYGLTPKEQQDLGI